MLDGVKFSEARMCIIRFPVMGRKLFFAVKTKAGAVGRAAGGEDYPGEKS